jgi:AraC family transcriptional regulator
MRPNETLVIDHINPVSDPQESLLSEAVVWQPTGDNRQLYGNLHELGISIEWHDFELDTNTTLDWSYSFHADSLALCLNVSGHGCIHGAGSCMEFEPLTAGFYSPGKNELRAYRKSGERHRFLTVEFSSRFLREHLFSFGCALHDLVEQIVFSGATPAGLGEVQRMTNEQEQFISQLQHPHACEGACQLWYQGKALQLMADFFFSPCCENEGPRCENKLICARQKRIARERVERVIAILRRDFAEPPTLEQIGRETGCSRFYLSRTFSRETGMTIPQYLRQLRMECAAELLRSGKCNVTEAAMEVGYSSLSHFSQTFCQIMGCCPALYPPKTPAQSTNNVASQPAGVNQQPAELHSC